MVVNLYKTIPLKTNINPIVIGVSIGAPNAIYKNSRVQKNIPIRQKKVRIISIIIILYYAPLFICFFSNHFASSITQDYRECYREFHSSQQIYTRHNHNHNLQKAQNHKSYCNTRQEL